MLKPLMRRFPRLHMIGIEGSGMSGLAEVLAGAGFKVTGSDLTENETGARLRSLGIPTFIGHSAELVNNADLVVYSSAVREDNVELRAAREQGLPVITRAEMLGELMRVKEGIGIAGTHGKTTITSLVGETLTAAGFNPTVIVGGRLKQRGSGVMAGGNEILVVEADEYDRSFLRLTPAVALISNIDYDHIECYGSLDELKNAFLTFAHATPFYGRVILCIDEPSLQELKPHIKRLTVTYGFSEQAEVRAVNARYEGSRSEFEVWVGGKFQGLVKSALPGRHNVQNAVGALAVGLELGADFKAMSKALENFGGIYRRFEIQGEANGIMVVDDFAHHPAEINATLNAARSGWNRRIVAVFQPHLYSRTRDLAEQFAQALSAAEIAVVLPIYPAREDPIEGVSSKLIYDQALALGHQNIHYLEEKSQCVDYVKSLARSGDMVIVLGAGDVYHLAPQILAGFRL
ncbi:MAG: UDP-N-acetylmuramate--L-alanine ligase [Calditrichota bacterium]